MMVGTELGAETLEPVVVGLNWDFAPGMPKFDMDCSAVCFGNTGSLVDAAFFNQLSACQGAVVHSGDCKDGRKEGMDETVTINFQKLAGVTAIVFLISAFAGGTLKDCESALCEDQARQQGRYSLSGFCWATFLRSFRFVIASLLLGYLSSLFALHSPLLATTMHCEYHLYLSNHPLTSHSTTTGPRNSEPCRSRGGRQVRRDHVHAVQALRHDEVELRQG